MTVSIAKTTKPIFKRILTFAITAAILLTFGGLSATEARADKWGSFKKQCVGDGAAKYSAILHGIPFGQSWERACARKGANINGKHRNHPTSCVNTGNAMWGEFVVRDASCNRPRAQLKWGSFKNNGCVMLDRKGWGMRSYSAVLWGIPNGQSWERTCARTPANVGGRHFSHPTACVVADLKDVARVTKVVAKAVARAAKKTKHPKIYLAAKGVALIAKVVKTVNPKLNVWGVFYVEDRNCPDFGGF